MARCRSAAFALFIVAALLTGTARLDRQRRRVPMVTGTQVNISPADHVEQDRRGHCLGPEAARRSVIGLAIHGLVTEKS